MAKVNPTDAVVTPALNALKASLADGYGSGATTTHHRALVLNIFAIATGDPRIAPNAVFDPTADYTKLGARGIELAQMAYVKFLHDPLNRIAITKASGDAQSAGVITLPGDREAAARALIVDMVDMILAYVDEAHYTTIWGIAKADYEPTWVDTNKDGIPDPLSIPLNLTAPVLTKPSGRDYVVTNGTWTGTPTGYTLVWYLDDVVIAGQTDGSWTAPSEAAGNVQVSVVARNAAGDSVRALSNVLVSAAA